MSQALSHLPVLDYWVGLGAPGRQETGKWGHACEGIRAGCVTSTGAAALSAWRPDARISNSALPSSMWPSPLKSSDHFSSFLSSTWSASLEKGFSSLLSFGAMRKSSLPRVSRVILSSHIGVSFWQGPFAWDYNSYQVTRNQVAPSRDLKEPRLLHLLHSVSDGVCLMGLRRFWLLSLGRPCVGLKMRKDRTVFVVR